MSLWKTVKINPHLLLIIIVVEGGGGGINLLNTHGFISSLLKIIKKV